MNREVRGGGRSGLSRQLLGLEAWNLAQREETQEKWRLGEKAGGRRTDERSEGAEEGASAVRWSLCCSLISDGQEEGQG